MLDRPRREKVSLRAAGHAPVPQQPPVQGFHRNEARRLGVAPQAPPEYEPEGAATPGPGDHLHLQRRVLCGVIDGV